MGPMRIRHLVDATILATKEELNRSVERRFARHYSLFDRKEGSNSNLHLSSERHCPMESPVVATYWKS